MYHMLSDRRTALTALEHQMVRGHWIITLTQQGINGKGRQG